MTNFDRAADFYDETRGLPPAEMDVFVQRLCEELGEARSVLEIGVGTGRVAVPLAQAGLQVTGVDISERMLAVLHAKGTPVDARIADATDLPFASDDFDAGLAVHVFHLIPRWQRAVAQLVRVVRPGGRIISPWFVTDIDPLEEWQQALLDAADAPHVQQPIGAPDADAVRDELQRLGALTSDGAPISATRTTTLRQLIRDFEVGVLSRHWRIADDVRAAAAARVLADVRARGLDLDSPHTTRAHIDVMTADLSAV